MPNHYHLLLETPQGQLSAGLRHVNGTYSQDFNRRHGRVGHLFQGRFKAFLVERDSYLLALSRYIHRNPVKAGLAERPWDYQWSSCRQLLGLEQAQAWLAPGPTLDLLGGDPANQVREYARFLSGGNGFDPAVEAVGQLLLGSEKFIAEMRNRARERAEADHELGPRNPLDTRPSASAILAAVARVTGQDPTRSTRWMKGPAVSRSLAFYALRRCGGVPLKEIAGRFGVSQATVSVAVSRFAAALLDDQVLRSMAERVLAALDEARLKTKDVTP